MWKVAALIHKVTNHLILHKYTNTFGLLKIFGGLVFCFIFCSAPFKCCMLHETLEEIKLEKKTKQVTWLLLESRIPVFHNHLLINQNPLKKIIKIWIIQKQYISKNMMFFIQSEDNSELFWVMERIESSQRPTTDCVYLSGNHITDAANLSLYHK